jgi:hypothetical protein
MVVMARAGVLTNFSQLSTQMDKSRLAVSAGWLKFLSVIICLAVIALPRILPFPSTFLAPMR